MKKWEYLILSSDEEEYEYEEDFLDEQGKLGWILCCVNNDKNVFNEDILYFYFRREIDNFEENK